MNVSQVLLHKNMLCHMLTIIIKGYSPCNFRYLLVMRKKMKNKDNKN